ncbi:inositol monophosphatase [Actinomycetospora endophytica]|uniref:Inositol-1-monophosphatase n=1 Tax=Actinomycetospora endophytica TaxID=2291215 RepID=A0ABS8PF43_9PSEU|nr:inositol monophosphatase family protein [Actinomycetospora endophytica]MCD2196848.1 inositol monophosphatase [Actinomycetospora endophytica]
MNDQVDGRELEKISVEVAREAAELALAVRDRVVGARSVADLPTKSSATDVVTAGDEECEALVRERLGVLRPGDVVLGEEGGADAEPEPGQVRWIVDPIDGTVNYAHGLPWFAVSLGVEVDGRPLAGAVVEPVSGRVWSAAAGCGAQLDGRTLRASALERPGLAVVSTGLAYDPARRRRQAALLARMAGEVGDFRRQGCASLDLCSVAAGWVDGYYEHGLNHWDWAAGALIAEEAGAVVRRPGAPGSEDPDGLGAEAVLAAAPGIAAGLADLLRAHGVAEV